MFCFQPSAFSLQPLHLTKLVNPDSANYLQSVGLFYASLRYLKAPAQRGQGGAELGIGPRRPEVADVIRADDAAAMQFDGLLLREAVHDEKFVYGITQRLNSSRET